MHVDPNRGAFGAWLRTTPQGPVTMLNLLRFRDLADYSATPGLSPGPGTTGAEAYAVYAAHALPYVRAAGAEVVLDATGGPALIGPDGERWDRVLLVRHASPQAFLAFADDEAYLAGLGHRTAALADSRLIPLSDPSQRG